MPFQVTENEIKNIPSVTHTDAIEPECYLGLTHF
jgi:hypothetical protein